MSARMFPSPTSLNLPVPPGVQSPSLPPNAAQAAHFQDLQHQVSVKSLALQTLQREYDSLLQKLERQRTKCATLERKFEVTDAEINSLTNEKERLERQVEGLEKQIEEAQMARDDARKSSAEQSSQYMKMIDMAGRLQGKAAEDRRIWEQEKNQLVERIKGLEMVSRQSTVVPPSAMSRADIEGIEEDTPAKGQSNIASPSREDLDQDETGHPAAAHQLQLPDANFASLDGELDSLRKEVAALKSRIRALEDALNVAREEGRKVRDAALTLAGCGQRTEAAVEKVFPTSCGTEG
jgi:chromosome segregation ATPase